MSKSCAVFYSPGVNGNGSELSLLQEAFKHCELSAVFHPIQDCQKLASTLDVDVLVAAGGDGTVNTVASEAYKLKKPLAVVPRGTLNHFSKDIGLPQVLLQAVEVIATGATIKIDVGTVNGLVFLNNCSLGLYPALVRRRMRLEKYIGKWFAAVVSTIFIASRRLHLYNIHMILDGKKVHKKSSLLFVGNNDYALRGVGVPARETLWDGKLNVLVLKTKRVDRLIKTAAYCLLAKTIPEKYIERYDCKNLAVEIGNKKELRIAYDGEIGKISTPFEVKLLQKALSVIVPKQEK